MANPSAETLIGLARDLLREESGSDVPVIADDFMLEAIGEADEELKDAFHQGGGNTPVSQALEDGYDLASETAVDNTAGVLTTDVSITVDSTSGFDSAGAAVIWTNDMPDVFFYTGTTATTFTGVTGLAFSHADNDAIQPLYALPSNFGTFRRSEDYGDGVQLNGDPLTAMEAPPRDGHFSLRDDGTTKYLWLPRGATGFASVWFDSDSNTIDSIDDLVSFDGTWRFFYAWRAIENALFGRGDFPIIAFAQARADRIKLRKLKVRNVGRRLRVRPMMGIRTLPSYIPASENV